MEVFLFVFYIFLFLKVFTIISKSDFIFIIQHRNVQQYTCLPIVFPFFNKPALSLKPQNPVPWGLKLMVCPQKYDHQKEHYQHHQLRFDACHCYYYNISVKDKHLTSNLFKVCVCVCVCVDLKIQNFRHNCHSQGFISYNWMSYYINIRLKMFVQSVFSMLFFTS